MDTEDDRFAYAQWILERNLHWIGAAEVKTGVIVTLNIAMLGGLAAAFTTKPIAAHSDWANLLSGGSIACLLAALISAAMSIFPRTDGPKTSFIYFGKIVESSRVDYADAFKRADKAAFLEDCLNQIHRNAEIACAKFRWVRNATGWSFVSVVPWVAAITCLLK